jgi:DNA-directed RNA polymerase subunit omega
VATPTELVEGEMNGRAVQEVDSKYRLIILAAKRSKQLQRGAQPRIEIDPQKHKPTRIALEEVMRGRVHFSIKEEENTD